MYKVIATKVGVGVSVVVAGLHYGAFAVTMAEDAMRNQIEKYKSQVIEYVAVTNGYERSSIQPDISDDEFTKQECGRRKTSYSLVRSLIHVESGGKQDIESWVGAIGTMQIMPANAKRCGVKKEELLNKRKNIACGVQILSEELRTYGGNTLEALWAYNGGPNAVKAIRKCGPYLPNGQFNIACLNAGCKDNKNPLACGYYQSAQHAKLVLQRLASGKEG